MTTDDDTRILEETHPEKTIVTHLGMQMIFKGPEKEARLIKKRTGIPTAAAVDGLKILLGETIDFQLPRKNQQV